MGAKTAQLQIRVTPQEKAALRRLAEAARMSVSRYVLAQALPSSAGRLGRVVAALAQDPREGLRALAELLAETAPAELASVLESAPVDQLPGVLANQVAAVVEHAAHVRHVEPPDWVHDVRPPRQPHFDWPLASLRPHQLRVTPVAFKRRRIFFDPASARAAPLAAVLHHVPESRGGPEALRRLSILNDVLGSSELKVEFYFVGGAVLTQPLSHRPPTAHVSALFGHADVLSDAMRKLTDREGWPTDWLRQSVREHCSGGQGAGRYLELSRLAAFVPPLDYALAVKVAALRNASEADALDDLRYLLRALNAETPDEALAVAARFFGRRQLPGGAKDVLSGLLRA